VLDAERFLRLGATVKLRLTGDELRALGFVIPMAALAGYVGAHKLVEPRAPSSAGSYELVGPVTHIRDGDTFEVSGVPVRIANLDCAERGTVAGDNATALMRRIASSATVSCSLEGRRSYDREIGICDIPGVGDVGEAMISAGACARWRW